MTKSKTNPKVDWYFTKAEQWRGESEKLREIILDCGLDEELKWGKPCYALGGANVVLVHGFKAYCALLFMKGALLKDPKKILIQQTENVQSARQIRFTTLREIEELAPVIKAYVKEAIEIEKSGAEVVLKKTSEFKMPEEFQRRLKGDAALKKAFEALTPGRQRGYLLYFSGAKQASTREARVEKNVLRILKGLGWDD